MSIDGMKTNQLIFIAALLTTFSVQAADSGCDQLISVPANLTVQAGFQESVSLPVAMTRLAVGAPDVADVALVDARTLLLQGKKAGSTSLLIWTACSTEPKRALVNVPSERSAAEQLASPSSSRDPVSAPIMTPEKLPSQVQADIRFVEVSRTRLQDVGTRLQLRSGSGRSNFFGSAGESAVQVSPGNAVPTVGMRLDPSSFNIVWGGNSSRFLSAINLLEQNGYAYTLSRPSLVALSGQSANFLAGGEIPIPIPQGISGSIAIEYKEFGVRLTISPTIISADQILLKVAPEVSELDFTNAVTIQNTSVPALRIRRTDTTISLADGESFIIGGLVSRSALSNVDKMPGLGDIPILGAFFRSTRFEAEDRELLMIVTPHLVRPLKRSAEMPDLPGQRWQRYQPGTGSLFWRGVTPLLNERLIPAGP